MNAMTEARYLTTLEDRFTIESGRIFLNGMQALLRLMLDQRRADVRAGLHTAGFVSGYPGSPVGGVDDVMLANQALLEQNHVVFKPGLNEELAATAVWGTQTLHAVPGARYDGVFGMWYGKSPGVDRASDALHHANFRGVGRNGGVLVVAGDDPHARSTIYPSDSNLALAGLYMPILAPANIQEVLDYGMHGYAMSRASGLWIGFKLVTDVADSCATAEVDPLRIQPVVPDIQYQGTAVGSGLLVNEVGGAMIEAERRMHDGRLEMVREYARLNGLNRIVSPAPGARLGILTGGKTYQDVCQALLNLGIDAQQQCRLGLRVLKMGMLYPMEPDIVREFAEGLEEILVVEDKRPLLELFVKDILYAQQLRPRVVGKKDPQGAELLTAAGEVSADLVTVALYRRLGALGIPVPRTPPGAVAPASAKPVIPLVSLASRTPYFCSGCPHNRSLKVPEGSVVGAGIGCHIMTLWMDDVFGEVKGYTQMGGEGAQWIGLQPFTTTSHFFQNLGDGTFHHSGSLAIRAAIAAGVNITYKLLHNRTVAMTGGQDVTGALSVAQIVHLLRAEGARRVLITTDEPGRYDSDMAGGAEVWHRDRLVEAEALLAATPGVTVLINDQHCAAEKRRLRKRGKMADRPQAAFINTRVCEGCGDCGAKSNCLSVQPVATEFGRKTHIHQSSCNQDLSCLDGDCPSFLTVVTKQGKRPRPPRKAVLEFPSDTRLPEPVRRLDGPYYNAVLIGIGGTGVVTVNQVLGMAAFMDGHGVQTYDQTGASQKAGPVVSHLKIFPAGEVVAPTVSRSDAHLYLAFDALGAVNPANLAMAASDRTVAVVSSSKVPTGGMVSNVGQSYPAHEELARRIDAVTCRENNIYLDAQSLAERLMGDHMANNFLMVGLAYQLGVLPISAEAIEAAIRLNGTGVKMNLDAFHWGRLQVCDPDRVRMVVDSAYAAAVPAAAAPAPAWLPDALPGLAQDDELGALVSSRVRELTAFQNQEYARRYVGLVQKLRLSPGASPALVLAVARNLYKLMAYKDEYEVARLHLDAEAGAALQGAFGKDMKVAWNFHPTFLRSLGVRKKVRLGNWFRPVLQLLRSLKCVRGTPLDLLGRTEVRRIERALPAYYVAMLTAALARPDASVSDLQALAESPDAIRGYEGVKLRNVAGFVRQTDALKRSLGIDVATPEVLAAHGGARPAAAGMATA